MIGADHRQRSRALASIAGSWLHICPIRKTLAHALHPSRPSGCCGPRRRDGRISPLRSSVSPPSTVVCSRLTTTPLLSSLSRGMVGLQLVTPVGGMALAQPLQGKTCTVVCVSEGSPAWSRSSPAAPSACAITELLCGGDAGGQGDALRCVSGPLPPTSCGRRVTCSGPPRCANTSWPWSGRSRRKRFRTYHTAA
jgi:hypothetical protein